MCKINTIRCKFRIWTILQGFIIEAIAAMKENWTLYKEIRSLRTRLQVFDLNVQVAIQWSPRKYLL